jgi:DNA-binding transcriptional ArsR family regulator
VGTLDTAELARLFADRSRVAMLDVLLDGEDHPAGELAQAAAVVSSTATEHLARLEEGGLIVSRRQGRHRLVRLAGPSVASAYEALAELSHESEARGLRAWTRRDQLRAARICYDHLAGRLGVAITEAAASQGALRRDDFSLDSSAGPWFGKLGVDVESLAPTRRPLIRACTDWTERREHLAGALGQVVCAAVLDAGWAVRRPSSRALRVTADGAAELRRLGIQVDAASLV